MSNNNWQWDNRESWNTRRRYFWYVFNRGRKTETNYQRTYRRGKWVGFVWGFLWCVQIVLTVAAVRVIFADRDVIVTRAATIAQ